MQPSPEVKDILGWTINTHMMTLQLPAHQHAKIRHTICNTLAKSRCSHKNWQKLIGLLRSSLPSLYGANHLFSSLQIA
jgi:hypothetical protein